MNETVLRSQTENEILNFQQDYPDSFSCSKIGQPKEQDKEMEVNFRKSASPFNPDKSKNSKMNLLDHSPSKNQHENLVRQLILNYSKQGIIIDFMKIVVTNLEA